jgi:hypothetical protein
VQAANLMARFEPGHSGRPKGVRNKLTTKFLTDFLADWDEHGAAAIKMMRIEDPISYVRIAASIVPKDVSIETSSLTELSDEDLDAMINKLRAQIEEERQTIDITPKPKVLTDGRH